MQIKEISDKLTISPRAIRFYEEKGLLTPAKNQENNYRDFTEKDVWRLQTIIALREVGMSIPDIKVALKQIDEGNHDELQYYLELQRYVMFAQWLELKENIRTTDQMIERLVQNKELSLEQIFTLAEGSKRLRDLRKNWHDKWNFDHQARTHDVHVLCNEQSFHIYQNYEEALDITLQWVDPIPKERGLDMGTGTGNLAARFIEKGIQMAGVDQSKEMLKQCKRKYPQMETKLGNFLAVPYLDNQFDFIVTSFAFHHITDAQKLMALDEMRRVLQPRGRICITDLMFENERHKKQYLDGLLKQGKRDIHTAIQDKYYANSEQLLDWFTRNGYIVKHQKLHELLYVMYAVPIR
ncbi:methyltransferase domain-containing protein [Brevibacillus laterosporus]|uniref:MerR family transcriptional regulator n=1 Tax=Brevibacillus laterosporus TaxID=1465 RepID=UPI002404BFCC|nr:MerR family transcriptional regulator [Brevibacillus laterosporus]MDF9410360.1 methyltransferase domain-containing protein [Brevibacillus laterosporus]